MRTGQNETVLESPGREQLVEVYESDGYRTSYVVAAEVVDGSLGKHGVVLELRLAERGSVAGDDDELGLVRAKALQGRLVAQGDCKLGRVSDGRS